MFSFFCYYGYYFYYYYDYDWYWYYCNCYQCFTPSVRFGTQNFFPFAKLWPRYFVASRFQGCKLLSIYGIFPLTELSKTDDVFRSTFWTHRPPSPPPENCAFGRNPTLFRSELLYFIVRLFTRFRHRKHFFFSLIENKNYFSKFRLGLKTEIKYFKFTIAISLNRYKYFFFNNYYF